MTFVVKYTPDGKIVYQHYVPKIGAGYFGTHATCLQHQEEEIIIFNTNPENLKQEPQHFSDLLPIEHHIFGQTIACAASFDPQGEQTKTVLLSSKETPFIIQPEALAFQYAPRSVIVMAKSKKNTDKFKLIRLDY